MYDAGYQFGGIEKKIMSKQIHNENTAPTSSYQAKSDFECACSEGEKNFLAGKTKKKAKKRFIYEDH